MLNLDLKNLTAFEIGTLVNNLEVSPVEVVNYFIHQVYLNNDNINAFTYLMPQEALDEAHELEKRLRSGEVLGPFAGVPVGLKDFLPSKTGWINTYGGVKSLMSVDTYDSEFYKAVKAMGAIATGKTNAPHFGFSGTCDNKLYGSTKNPYNLEYNSGGSSGGSAAAVASGMLPLAEGGDAGGSIRIPASWCNCFGFKASSGLIPNVCRPDGWSATHPFCTPGGLTKDVTDSALLLNYMARYDPRDPYSVQTNKNFYELMKHSIKGMRIGFTEGFNLFDTDKEIVEKVKETSKILDSYADAEVEPVTFEFKSDAKTYADMWCLAISIDTSLDIYNWKQAGMNLIKEHRDELSKEFIYWNELAFKEDIHTFRKFNELRTEILDAFETVFENHDIILGPVTACMPVLNKKDGNTRGPEKYGNNVIGFTETFLVNFIGYPAASVPVGFSKTGLPIGLQVIGKKYEDEKVLQVCKTIEDLLKS